MPIVDRLEPLLVAAGEALDVECKSWLDLQRDDEHKAILAKAAVALANEGGGHIILGLRENGTELISEPRPADIPRYGQDFINQIVRRFATPAFHCLLVYLPHPVTGHEHAVIVVPGGFGFPVMSKSGTPGNTIRPHVCYMRKPGPESAPPENQADWEKLLSRCLRQRREDMLDAIRAIVEGTAGNNVRPAADTDLQEAFCSAARDRWEALVRNLPQEDAARCPHGHFELDYAILGNFEPPGLADLRQHLRNAVVRHTGWPEFWVPTRAEIVPAPIDDLIECWIGALPDRDSGHVDFWRADPAGRMFLLRGYIEDAPELFNGRVAPGTVLDLTTPIWRVAECLMHASNMARLLGSGQEATVLIRARWFGLAGRHLASLTAFEPYQFFSEHVSRQDSYSTAATVDLHKVPDNLPEIVHSLLRPFYERFGFFRLELRLVTNEIAKMRGNRF